jgi:hypothetical protein
METYNGDFISGNINPDKKEFTIRKIKNTPAYSVWNEQQLRKMYDQITKVKNSGEDSLVMTYGMFPIQLNRNEIERLHEDLRAVLTQTEQL